MSLKWRSTTVNGTSKDYFFDEIQRTRVRVTVFENASRHIIASQHLHCTKDTMRRNTPTSSKRHQPLLTISLTANPTSHSQSSLSLTARPSFACHSSISPSPLILTNFSILFENKTAHAQSLSENVICPVKKHF
jgi:hypothetical protein